LGGGEKKRRNRVKPLPFLEKARATFEIATTKRVISAPEKGGGGGRVSSSKPPGGKKIVSVTTYVGRLRGPIGKGGAEFNLEFGKPKRSTAMGKKKKGGGRKFTFRIEEQGSALAAGQKM